MNAAELIRKKRDGETFTRAEIQWWIEGASRETIPTYQTAAWLMAVWFKGMTDQETAWLTEAMIHSGDTVDLSPLKGAKVDKHSTGGVGDTTTLILAPLLAAAGAQVAKMSGRGLGHTGGTLDKMEAAGLNVDLTREQFLAQVETEGLAVISQTKSLVPADGVFYALRDVTSTIDSIPLIASSIMSKKIACGADCILLDVKYGAGAFMSNFEEAKILARSMVEIGNNLGRTVRAALTPMEQPLGTHIGNALEFREAIAVLTSGKVDSDLGRVALQLASHLLVMAELATDLAAAESKLLELLKSGAAAERLKALIRAQGGDPAIVDEPERLPRAPILHPVAAPEGGRIGALNALKLGKAALTLGAGRQRKEDKVDPAVGIVLEKRLGDPVESGETVAVLHAPDESRAQEAERQFLEALAIQAHSPTLEPLVREVVQ